MVREMCKASVLCSFLVLVFTVGVSQARFLSPRQARTAPRGRIACLPSSTVGTRYPNPFALGNHAYRGLGLTERNGIVYTCRGGHVDITHVRKLADWTAYLASLSREAILANRDQFTYRMREPSIYHVRIEYPEGWRDLPAKERDEIAREVSIHLGKYFAYTGSVWHEILTWFGFRGFALYSEYLSAFSWEDNFSNAWGCYVGELALRDPEHEFSKALTLALNRELSKLGVQPKAVARQAGELVRDSWFTGDFLLCRMVKRHFDVGWDDGFVTPWLVPGAPGCDDAQPLDWPVPGLASLREYGFRVSLEIEPKELEKAAILRIIYPNGRPWGRIVPTAHFGPIIEHIRGQAIERYGPQVDNCGLDAPAVTRTRSRRGPAAGRIATGATQNADSLDLATLAARWLSDETS